MDIITYAAIRLADMGLLALWSRVSVAGYRVTRAGAEIITRKGATQFGVEVGLA